MLRTNVVDIKVNPDRLVSPLVRALQTGTACTTQDGEVREALRDAANAILNAQPERYFYHLHFSHNDSKYFL